MVVVVVKSSSLVVVVVVVVVVVAAAVIVVVVSLPRMVVLVLSLCESQREWRRPLWGAPFRVGVMP